MKRILLALVMVLAFSATAYAAPFLICDPQTGVTHYKVTGPAWVVSPVTAQPDGSIRMDVAASPQGVNALTVAACIADTTWGELCSTTSPFSYARPGAPGGPSNLRLTP